jgi:hypothetical protein
MTVTAVTVKNGTAGPDYVVLGDQVTIDGVEGIAQFNKLLNGTPAETIGTITANAQTVELDVSQAAVASFAIFGTYAGLNVTFEVSYNGGTTWWVIMAQRSDTGGVATSSGVITSNSTWSWDIPTQGADRFRVRATAFTSGTANIILKALPVGSDPITTNVPNGTQTVSGVVTAQGTAVIDAAVTGTPVIAGVRAHSLVPTAMSADNDTQAIWTDRSGAVVVVPQERQVRLTATPTITAGAYTALDQVGTLMTFTGAALAIGRAGRIVNVTLTDRAKANALLTLWLFATSPTLASVDNGLFDLTDANLEAAGFIGHVDFLVANYRPTVSGSACRGDIIGGGEELPFVSTATANIFGVLVCTATPAYTSTTDLVVGLTSRQM